MLITDLEVAIAESERFLNIARPLLAGSLSGQKSCSYKLLHTDSACLHGGMTSRQNASVKRASLDLSNALVNVRKNRQ